jgi:HAD superfamily hydrolase (TIGR01490 family)
MTQPVKLAIYDMDRTVTRAGTYTPFLLHVARHRAPWRLLLAPLVPFVMLAYVLKRITRSRLKEINQQLLLGGRVPRAALAPHVESFAQFTMAANIRPGALARLAADRAAGYRLVLATASYRLYVEAIARHLGFDDVIATGSVLGIDEYVHARIDGENCYGEAKLRMIEAWLAAQGIARENAHVRFYSDHISDAPVMDWADEAFAVHPSRRLRKLLIGKGWPALDWR